MRYLFPIKLLLFVLTSLGVKHSLCQAEPYQSQNSQTPDVQEQSVEVPLRGGERFQLFANQVHLTWVVTSGPTLKIRGLSSRQGVRRGDLLVFDLKETSSKEDFAAFLKKKGPPLKIEIQGPSMPIELSLHEGQIVLNKTSHEVSVQMIQGSISIAQAKGPLLLRLHKGQISAREVTGKTGIELYSGQAVLKELGDSTISIFSGNLSIQDLQGTLALNTQSVVSKVAGMSGTLTLDSQKGSLNLTQFQGRLEGQTVEGLVSAQILPETDVQLKSKSGRFNFQVPPGSGAYLNLWTAEGEIIIPKDLSVARSTTEKSVRGRLRGESQKITISAKTSEGVVVVK